MQISLHPHTVKNKRKCWFRCHAKLYLLYRKAHEKHTHTLLHQVISYTIRTIRSMKKQKLQLFVPFVKGEMKLVKSVATKYELGHFVVLFKKRKTHSAWLSTSRRSDQPTIVFCVQKVHTLASIWNAPGFQLTIQRSEWVTWPPAKICVRRHGVMYENTPRRPEFESHVLRFLRPNHDVFSNPNNVVPLPKPNRVKRVIQTPGWQN